MPPHPTPVCGDALFSWTKLIGLFVVECHISSRFLISDLKFEHNGRPIYVCVHLSSCSQPQGHENSKLSTRDNHRMPQEDELQQILGQVSVSVAKKCIVVLVAQLPQSQVSLWQQQKAMGCSRHLGKTSVHQAPPLHFECFGQSTLAASPYSTPHIRHPGKSHLNLSFCCLQVINSY